jgi:hypothetical protein
MSVKGGIMNSRHINILVLGLMLLPFCSHGVARAQQAQWTPELLQPATSTRAPTDPLRIRLANVPEKTLELLALELDEIDVTSMVTMDGDVVVYMPPQPLNYGKHQLRLVEHSQDGNINVRGQWTFELRKSALFRDAQVNGNVTINGGYRTSDKGLSDPAPDRGQADGNGQFNWSAENENWHTSGTLSIIANTQSQLMPRQAGHIDLGQYLAAADSGMFGIKVGDHAIGSDSLILQSFSRRGISASATTPDNKAALTVFSMHTTPITGAVNVLGVADSANLVNGAVATVQPIPSNVESLALMGAYVNGESNGQTSTNVIGGPGASGGSAGSIIADSNLLQQRLRLRGELAKSSYDFDGSSGDLAPLGGHAYSGLVTYVPWSDMVVTGHPFLWNLGLEKKLISTYFHSPSNPGGISDRDMSRIFTGVNWYGFDVQINAGKESDNVDDNPLIPVTDSRQRSSVITYSPQVNYAPQANGQPLETPWYGMPSFNVSFMSLNKDIAQLNGAVGGALNQPVHSTYTSIAGANFQYVTWDWGIMQTWVKDQGYNLDTTPFTRTAATQLHGNFRFLEKLTAGMNAFSQNVDYVNAGTQTNGVGGGLNLAYPFTDKINSSLAYSTRHDWSTNGSGNTVASNTTAALSWVVKTPHGVTPGVKLGMDGSYQDVSNNSAAYQVFLRLSLSWAPGY